MKAKKRATSWQQQKTTKLVVKTLSVRVKASEMLLYRELNNVKASKKNDALKKVLKEREIN